MSNDGHIYHMLWVTAMRPYTMQYGNNRTLILNTVGPPLPAHEVGMGCNQMIMAFDI